MTLLLTLLRAYTHCYKDTATYDIFTIEEMSFYIRVGYWLKKDDSSMSDTPPF